jgi:branched-chain amino acid transport system ATP-binding protein
LRGQGSRRLLQFVGLGHHEDELAKDLTLIEKKKLEMARPWHKTKVLLLDEVLADLNPSEFSRPWNSSK